MEARASTSGERGGHHLGKRQRRWDEKRTPAWCEGLPDFAFLGQEGEQKAEGGKERLRSVIASGKCSPYIPPAAPLPLPHPPAPLVSINETAFSLQKEIATPAVAGPETPHHQRILMESCKGTHFHALFNAPLAIILTTSPCSFPARVAVNPRLVPFPSSQCRE